ncbi:hypothetical protein [Streptomyces sp. NPDC002580]|uniref:hypothetical protein n=1 Tax=Streptomyces sp. NPDC002580 TaxID=3364653 RepID=UPI00367C606B
MNGEQRLPDGASGTEQDLIVREFQAVAPSPRRVGDPETRRPVNRGGGPATTPSRFEKPV